MNLMKEFIHVHGITWDYMNFFPKISTFPSSLMSSLIIKYNNLSEAALNHRPTAAVKKERHQFLHFTLTQM